MKSKNKHYMKLAKQVSYKSDYSKNPTGCVIVYKNSILAYGYNSIKTHPLQCLYNKYRFNLTFAPYESKLHAEIMALSKIQYLDINFSKVKIYIYRQKGKDKKFGLARPCESCMKMIKDFGIKEIYYSTNSQFIQKEIIK